MDAIREAMGQLTPTGTSDWQGFTQAVQTMIDVGVNAGHHSCAGRLVKAGITNRRSQASKSSSVSSTCTTARYFCGDRRTKSGKKAQKRLTSLMKCRAVGNSLLGRMERWICQSSILRWRNLDERPVVGTPPKPLKKKRFFHWELEFPEVFYGRRNGTKTVVERLDKAGFDAVIGNPPYDELSEFYSDTEAAEKNYLSDASPYHGYKNGRVNLYRLFILRGLQNLTVGRLLSYINSGVAAGG